MKMVNSLHPATGVYIGAVSLASNQPLSVTVADADVKTGIESVGTVPVAVYVGRAVALFPGASVAGGHGLAALTDAAKAPAPAPPVISAVRGVLGEAPPQTPTAERGSVGIHPFSSPSW